MCLHIEQERYMNRTGENGNHPTRSKRVFQSGNYWYYTTREDIEIGPFDSASEAETGVRDFVDFILHAEPAIAQTLSLYARAA